MQYDGMITTLLMRKEETITTRSYTFTVVFEPAEEGGYMVTCPALPGLVTEGDTLEEARRMAADAIHGYLESLKELGRPLPIGANLRVIGG